MFFASNVLILLLSMVRFRFLMLSNLGPVILIYGSWLFVFMEYFL